MICNGIETRPEKCSAPCPEDITCGVSSASRPTAKPPSAHDQDAEQRCQNPEQRGQREIASDHVANRADADAERQFLKSVGDEIACHSGDADRRQAR
jgi:hypothetical protein